MSNHNLFDEHPRLAEDADDVIDENPNPHDTDFDVQFPGRELEARKRHRFRRGPFRMPDERLVHLLANAGYDAGGIPKNRRQLALAVIGCWSKGIHDERDLATVLGRNVKLVEEVCGLLRTAGEP